MTLTTTYFRTRICILLKNNPQTSTLSLNTFKNHRHQPPQTNSSQCLLLKTLRTPLSSSSWCFKSNISSYNHSCTRSLRRTMQTINNSSWSNRCNTHRCRCSSWWCLYNSSSWIRILEPGDSRQSQGCR